MRWPLFEINTSHTKIISRRVERTISSTSVDSDNVVQFGTMREERPLKA